MVRIDKDGITTDVQTPFCSLTKKEAYAVAEFVDCNLFDNIRNDISINSMEWLKNILHAYEKMCAASGFVGLTEHVEGEDENEN